MTRTTDLSEADLADFEARVGHLRAEDLAHLAAVLQARANERRVVLTVERCASAIAAAPLSTAWESSCLSDAGRTRAAVRLLVGDQRLHPEQVDLPMRAVALSLGLHPAVVDEAIACGVADGLAQREGSRS